MQFTRCREGEERKRRRRRRRRREGKKQDGNEARQSVRRSKGDRVRGIGRWRERERDG